MSRDVCGICWCPYDEDGECGCSPEPAQVLDQYSLAKIKDDEALLRQSLKTLEQCYESLPLIFAKDIEPVIDTLKERLK